MMAKLSPPPQSSAPGAVCWGMLLTVLSLLSYVIISIGWGMWIGAHNDIFKPAGFIQSVAKQSSEFKDHGPSLAAYL